MTTMNRDQISMTAWQASREVEMRATTPAQYALAGRLHQLNNDCCETQHTLKSLRRRLSDLLRQAAAT
jgi:uncharacterized membrane-anchored protein YjiN (DUF445 family)